MNMHMIPLLSLSANPVSPGHHAIKLPVISPTVYRKIGCFVKPCNKEDGTGGKS
jgi:hypothetical protein